MRRLILFIFTFLLFSMNGFAAIIRDVVIDGVGYSLDKGIKTATVVDDDALRAETFSIPETITVDGVVYTVTAIQTNAFYSNSKLQKIVIPKTIKTIGEYAFVNCRELATVTLSEGLEIIGFSAFNGTAITDIMIPSTVKELSAYSFPYEFYLKSATSHIA